MKIRSVSHLHSISPTGLAAAALGVVLLFGFAGTAGAQSVAKAKIDFAFVAGKTECPAGEYELQASGTNITLQSKDSKGAHLFLPVITRLGRHDKDPDVELVFDKVNDKFLLSEIWMPGADGYLLTTTAADHVHRVVGGSNPHK